MNLCDLDTIRSVLSHHGFHFSKSLGQNFLCDESVPPAIADGAGLDGETCVLEVGPGIGTLSRELCVRARKVTAVELDRRLPAVLSETMAEHGNFTLVEGDILKIDLPELCAKEFGCGRAVACANLPYYITTPAITTLLESRCFDSITVMVQKEVAQRICAQPGTAAYGAFTVYINCYAQAAMILDVPRTCFLPSPKVDSAVVRLDVRKQPPDCVKNTKLLFRVVRAAFGQRRKTLLNAMSQGFSNWDKQALSELLRSCEIDPGCRGETLSLEQFAQIASALER